MIDTVISGGQTESYQGDRHSHIRGTESYQGDRHSHYQGDRQSYQVDSHVRVIDTVVSE